MSQSFMPRNALLRRCALLSAAVANLLLTQGAFAQTVNYGALEQLFGEPVTTGATGQPQRVTEAPAAIEIVSAEKIRRSGAVDIPGVLRQVPSLDVQRWGTADSDVSIRGYDQAYSARLLVLIDGRQVYADQYGYTPWGALPVELAAIRQIEVVKGPNTALFGANAVNGVINIITYNPLYDAVNTVSVTGGTQGAIRGSAVTTIGDNGRWALRLSGSADHDNDFSTPIPPNANLDARRSNDRAAIDAYGIVQLGPRAQFSLDASHSQTLTNAIDPTYELAHTQYVTSSLKGQLNIDSRFGMVQAMAYTNWISEKTLDQPLRAVSLRNQSTVVQLQDVISVGTSHVFRAALEFRHNQVNTSPVEGAHVYYDMPSISGMWNWTISPSLAWTNAVRLDDLSLGRNGSAPAGYPFPNSRWDRSLKEWSFNSGLVWRASDDDTVRLLVSRGIQLPSLLHFGGLVLSTPFINATGYPDMRTAAIMNYEADWDRQIDAIGALLRGAVFYQKTDDVIGNVGGILPGPPPYRIMGNIGTSEALGGEFSLSGKFSDHWNWGLSYRMEGITDNFIPISKNGAGFIDYQHQTPRHQARANLGWAQGSWETDLSFYYQSATQGVAPQPFFNTALAPVPDFLNADARIGYRINKTLTLSLSGQNLLTAQQVQNTSPAQERRVFVNLSAGF